MKTKVFRCPCCGTPLPDRMDPHKLVKHLPINGLRLAVLRTLAANFGREVSGEVLTNKVWAGVTGGGPLTARQSIKVMTHQLRKLLKPYGLTIKGTASRVGSEGGTHRLEWVDAPALEKNHGA